jgi:hypothetical protein
MHSVSSAQPTTLAALVVARFLEGGGSSQSGGGGGDGSCEVSSNGSSNGSGGGGGAGGANDEGRSVGLRLLTAYMARLGAQTTAPGLSAAIRRTVSGGQPSVSSLAARAASGPSAAAAKFYSTGLTLLHRSLAKHQRWVGEASYAALLEMVLVGDEDAFGWHANDAASPAWNSIADAPPPPPPLTLDQGPSLSPPKTPPTGSAALSGATELRALLKLGKHMTPVQTQRAEELLKLGLMVTAATAQQATTSGGVAPQLPLPPLPPTDDAPHGDEAAPLPSLDAEPPPPPLTPPPLVSTNLPSGVDIDAVSSDALYVPVFDATPLDPARVFGLALPRLEVSSGEALSLLLRLLPTLSAQLQTRACADLLRLLSLRPTNASFLAKAPHWQPALFALLAPHVTAADAPSPPGLPEDACSAQDPNAFGRRVRVSFLARLQTTASYSHRDAGSANSPAFAGARRPGKTAQDLAAEFGGVVEEAMKSRNDAVIDEHSMTQPRSHTFMHLHSFSVAPLGYLELPSPSRLKHVLSR